MLAGIDRPVTVHGIRHSFHDLARQQGVPDAVVKAMAGRAGTEVKQRGQDKHLHYSRGVTVEEMRPSSALAVPAAPTSTIASVMIRMQRAYPACLAGGRVVPRTHAERMPLNPRSSLEYADLRRRASAPLR